MLGGLGVIVLGMLTWRVLVRGDPEPVIVGKPLTFWLENYSSGYSLDRAIKNAGTNAIPILLRMLRQNDSALKLECISLARRQNLIEIHHFPARKQNLIACHAFGELGDLARSAVPDLVKIYQLGISDWSRAWTAGSLGGIGPAAREAVPLLLQGTTNSSVIVRSECVVALGHIHSELDLVVPVLTNSLKDTNAFVRLSACTTLASLGKEAKQWVPELTKLLNHPDREVRDCASNVADSIDPALERIRPEALKTIEAETARRNSWKWSR
jgi:HEAT repeat protein